mmetsp:Transcript_5467/g.12961  ORF Transcript_5467/g.12961 Transcript_5467/m.12961 type:complete len:267 (+) Transcript_5467:502-1302(+)
MSSSRRLNIWEGERFAMSFGICTLSACNSSDPRRPVGATPFRPPLACNVDTWSCSSCHLRRSSSSSCSHACLAPSNAACPSSLASPTQRLHFSSHSRSASASASFNRFASSASRAASRSRCSFSHVCLASSNLCSNSRAESVAPARAAARCCSISSSHARRASANLVLHWTSAWCIASSTAFSTASSFANSAKRCRSSSSSSSRSGWATTGLGGDLSRSVFSLIRRATVASLRSISASNSRSLASAADRLVCSGESRSISRRRRPT